MSVVLIDYGSGNLHSAQKALERAALEAGLYCSVEVSADPDVVARAERLVLPGVGAFGDCIQGLKAVSGLVEALEEAVRQRATPFLGICVGMQLLARFGFEHGQHEGLHWLEADVERLEVAPSLKIPHMGWNTLDIRSDHPLLAGIESGCDVYYVHSYAFHDVTSEFVLATTTYGAPFAAVVGRDTFVGVQFHPEKSQAVGLHLLRQFLCWKP